MNKRELSTGVVTWIFFLALYMLFCGKPDPIEAVAGGAAALLALKLVAMLRDSFISPLRVKLSWLFLVDTGVFSFD